MLSIPHILLAGPSPGDRLESIERFVRCLADGLKAHGEVEIVAPTPILGRFAVGAVAHKWLGYADKYLFFRRALTRKRRRDTIVHLCDQGAAAYAPNRSKAPYLLTCYDLIAIRSALGEFSEHRTRWSGQRLQKLILRGMSRATRVACISDATRRDLLRSSPCAEDRVNVVPLALDPKFRPTPPARAHSILKGFRTDLCRTPYILHVGGNQWYKNRAGVLAIYRELVRAHETDAHLVFVGKPLTPQLVRSIQKSRLANRVHCFSEVSDEDLCAFYSEARLLLFPSLCEGFGWPILEAQACGCPVVTTNRDPMISVGGDAADYIDPANLPDSAQTLRELLLQPAPLRTARIECGRDNARRFSLPAMVEGYLELYRELAISPKSAEISAVLTRSNCQKYT